MSHEVEEIWEFCRERRVTQQIGVIRKPPKGICQMSKRDRKTSPNLKKKGWWSRFIEKMEKLNAQSDRASCRR
jgi:hypothetical protein